MFSMHAARVRRNDNEEYAEHAKYYKEYAEFKEHKMSYVVSDNELKLL